MSSIPVETTLNPSAAYAGRVENESIVDAEVQTEGFLVLKQHDGTAFNVGRVLSEVSATPTPSIVSLGEYSLGSYDHVVMEWNPRSNSDPNPEIAVGSLGTSISNVSDLAWSANGLFLAIAGPLGTDSLAIIGRSSLYSESFYLSKILNSAQNVRKVSWSPTGSFIALGCTSGAFLRIYSWLSSPSTFTSLTAPTLPASVVDLSWSPSSSQLAVTCSNGRVYLVQHSWASTSFNLVGEIDSTITNPSLGDVSWSACERFLAIPTTSGVEVLNIEDPSAPFLMTVPDKTMGGTQGLSTAWSPDGKYLAATSRVDSSTIRTQVWRREGQIFTLIHMESESANASGRIAWHPDGQAWGVLKTNSSSAAVRVRRVLADDVSESSANLTTTSVATLSALIWSPDGGILALGHSAGLKLYSSMRGPVQAGVYSVTPVP